MSGEQTQVCSKCKIKKPLSKFFKNKKRNRGVQAYCKQCSKKDNLERRKNTPKGVNYINDRKYRFKSCYGITPKDWGKMFTKQNGYCALCGKCQSELTRCLDVDHNHLTGKVRGLLCSECNTGLGKFRVDEKGIELLEKAINYLKGDRNEDA